MTRSQVKGFCMTLVAVLALLVVACAGKQTPAQNQQLQATVSALQTQAAVSNQQAAQPTATPVPGQSGSENAQLLATVAALQTQLAQPTATAVIPTFTPIPSPTLLPDTPPNTVLEVGQTWRQGGMELTLTEVSIANHPTGPGNWSSGYPAPYVTFRLTNRKIQQISIRYNIADAVSATDNLGRRLAIGCTHMAVERLDAYDNFDTYAVVMDSGKSIYLQSWGDYGPPSALILADTTDPALTEITVSVSVSSIVNARWRIPIAH